MSGGAKLVSVDFEVFGKVQGVFFRKCTQDEAEKLRLTGWVMNTSSGTVKGVIEGSKENVDKMKEWLQKTGSPHSRIEKAVFSTETEIDAAVFSSFRVKS